MTMRNVMRAAAVTVLAALMLSAAACKKQDPAQALPGSNQLSGWEKTGETRSYTASNLSDYIDGGAEQYIKAGFKSASTSDYKYQGKVEAVADVYLMTNTDAAKTIFEADPAGNAKTIALGDAARAYGQSVVFREGPYLVRVTAYQETPETPNALQQLAQGIEKKLSK